MATTRRRRFNFFIFQYFAYNPGEAKTKISVIIAIKLYFRKEFFIFTPFEKLKTKRIENSFRDRKYPFVFVDMPYPCNWSYSFGLFQKQGDQGIRPLAATCAYCPAIFIVLPDIDAYSCAILQNSPTQNPNTCDYCSVRQQPVDGGFRRFGQNKGAASGF
jgi:hypothetical protein